METTGQRYVYTGSSDGNISIYDLVTGDTAGVLKKPANTSRQDHYGYHYGGRARNSPCRDISWHPFLPVLASTEFNGNVNIWTLQNLNSEEQALLRKAEEEESKAAE